MNWSVCGWSWTFTHGQKLGNEGCTFITPGTWRSPCQTFAMVWFSGVEEWHEVKGAWTRKDVSKLRLLARHYPEIVVATVGAKLTDKDKAAIERAREITMGERAKAERKARKEA